MMRNSDCYRVAKMVLPEMPGFVSNKKSEIFMAPIGDVLRGFLFEGTSGPREDFYFCWFFMPICKPTDFISLSNGRRLDVPGGHAGWRTDMEDLPGKMLRSMQPVLPFLRSINTPTEAIEALYQFRGEKTYSFARKRTVSDIYVQHDIACLHILEGQFEEAAAMIETVIAHEHGADRRQWLLDVVERTKGLRDKLLADPQLAVAQIREWQDFTFRALKLERWR